MGYGEREHFIGTRTSHQFDAQIEQIETKSKTNANWIENHQVGIRLPRAREMQSIAVFLLRSRSERVYRRFDYIWGYIKMRTEPNVNKTNTFCGFSCVFFSLWLIPAFTFARQSKTFHLFFFFFFVLIFVCITVLFRCCCLMMMNSIEREHSSRRIRHSVDAKTCQTAIMWICHMNLWICPLCASGIGTNNAYATCSTIKPSIRIEFGLIPIYSNK